MFSQPTRLPLQHSLYNFPRNLAPDFTHYLSERPELTSHRGKPKKAKTNERKLSYENKIN
jgi:hypothetical protein